MKFTKLKLIFIVFSILILTALALPEFNFDFRGKEYTYPGIGFGKIGIGTDFGSFVKSKGIFAENKYYTLIDLTDENLDDNQKREKAEEVKNIIEKRIEYARLYDITLGLEKKNDNYYITLEIPQNYDNPEEYAKWISGNGTVEFFQGFSTDDSGKIDLNDYDIVGNIQFETIVIGEQSYKTFTFNITDEKAAVISGLVSDSQAGGLVMGVNDTPAFLIQPAVSTTNQNYKATYLRAVPLGTYSSNAVLDYINIIRSYFQEIQPIDVPLKLESSIQNVRPTYNVEGASIITVTFIISLALACLYLLQKYGVKKALFAATLLATFLLIYIDALKFVRANLSYGTVLGVIFTIIITVVFVSEFINSNKDNYLSVLKKYRSIAFAMLVNIIILYKLNFNLGFLYDFIGATLLATMALILVSYTYFKYFKEVNLYLKKSKNEKN